MIQMTQEEYDKRFKSAAPLVTEEVVGLEESPLRPKVTIINSTPEEQYVEEMRVLQDGGADYGGREDLRSFMRGLGR